MKILPFQEKIVSLFQSDALKTAIKKEGYRFSEAEMFALACKTSATDSERGFRLREMLTIFNDKDVLCAVERKLEYDTDLLSVFIENDGEYFYDVIAKEIDSQHEYRQAFSSYFDALTYIGSHAVFFFDGYIENKIKIEKRRMTALPEYDNAFSGTVGHCILTANAELISIEIDSMTECGEGQKSECVDCQELCSENIAVTYPRFLSDFDLVSYKINEKTEYGVFFLFNDESDFVDTAYIHPLNSKHIFARDYENLSDDHLRIDFFLVDKADINDVDEWIKNAYYEYKSYYDTCED